MWTCKARVELVGVLAPLHGAVDAREALASLQQAPAGGPLGFQAMVIVSMDGGRAGREQTSAAARAASKLEGAVLGSRFGKPVGLLIAFNIGMASLGRLYSHVYETHVGTCNCQCVITSYLLP